MVDWRHSVRRNYQCNKYIKLKSSLAGTSGVRSFSCTMHTKPWRKRATKSVTEQFTGSLKDQFCGTSNDSSNREKIQSHVHRSTRKLLLAQQPTVQLDFFFLDWLVVSSSPWLLSPSSSARGSSVSTFTVTVSPFSLLFRVLAMSWS